MEFGHKDLINIDKQMCFALYTANKRFTKFYSEVLDEYHLTYPQYLVLSNLWDSKEPMTIRQLGQSVNLDSGTLTPLMKRLELNGWVNRTKDESDDRRILVCLTDKAATNKNAIVNAIRSKLNQLNMTDQEYRDRVQEVHDISKRLDKILAEI